MLTLVKEMDDEKQGVGSSRHSERTGRTQVETPWMKTSPGVGSAYHVYKQTDATAGADVADGTSATGRQAVGAELDRSTGAAQPSVSTTKSSPKSSSTATVGVHSPMGYKPVSVPSRTTQTQSFESSSASASSNTLDKPGTIGFRSVSPVLGAEAKKAPAGAAASVLDRNFNLKPRPFGFSPSQPSRVEPPVPTTSQSRAPPADTGPGYGGPKMFTPPIWSERSGTTEHSTPSYSGTEAHGADSSEPTSHPSSYPDPSEPSTGNAFFYVCKSPCCSQSFSLALSVSMADPAEGKPEPEVASAGTGPIRKKYSEYSDEPIGARPPTQSRSFQTLQGYVDPDQGIYFHPKDLQLDWSFDRIGSRA